MSVEKRECEGDVCVIGDLEVSDETVSMLDIEVVLGEGGKIPLSSFGNAGNDLYSTSQETISPGESAIFDTRVHMAIKDGCYGKIEARSGLAFNHGIAVEGGIIDSSYRGPIKVKLRNHGSEPVQIEVGQRIAQLIIMRHEYVNFVVVDKLSETDRGEKGFGSSGK